MIDTNQFKCRFIAEIDNPTSLSALISIALWSSSSFCPAPAAANRTPHVPRRHRQCASHIVSAGSAADAHPATATLNPAHHHWPVNRIAPPT
ncbi:hypothetical protein KCP70_08135 [Salmonella enterica subsp. enterica]|nr:hypothetical protein KCP70_08135 [Salmonella enterica subsp. enterica]